MNLIVCTDVLRDKGEPLFQVAIYDIDTPVNYHSYECYFFKQGRDLNSLLEEANKKREKELNVSENNKGAKTHLSVADKLNMEQQFGENF